MLETGTKERSWRKLVSEVRSCSRREAFQSFFTVDVLPGCRPAELHALLGRLRGVDKSLSALELAPRVLVFAVPLELCQDFVEEPDGSLLPQARASFFHLSS